MAKVTDSGFNAGFHITGKTAVICDYSPPRSGLLSQVPAPPPAADFLLVNCNPGRSVRADSAMLAAVLRQQTGQEVIFALLTRDMNRLALQSYLLGAQLLGLENVVVAQGDDFAPSDGGRVQSVRDYKPTELIKDLSAMNLGRDFRGRPLAAPTNFCIGATLDPARNLKGQVKLSAQKVAAGAGFLLSQPIYDPQVVGAFQESCAEITGNPFPIPVYWGLQMLELGGISFGPVPARMQRDLERGRSGVEIALELYGRFRDYAIENIYLLPPIRRGGERDYGAAQEFLSTLRAQD